MLTLEFLDGTQIVDLHPDELSEDERRRLAYAMAEAWMTMVFRHGIFHGDLIRPTSSCSVIPSESGSSTSARPAG